ncbi:MAG: hypothetical protein WC564_01490 [Patescibacteria group bacterium]|jgi:hypothetical protein
MTEKPIQIIPNLKVFLEERAAKLRFLNAEIEDLKLRLNKEADDYKETVLFSIPMEETIVLLNQQILDNFFSGCEYPASGIFLREIKIIRTEYIEDKDFEYCHNVIARFEFNKECFNTHISINKFAYDEERQDINEETMGVGFDPHFVDKEKFTEVINALMAAQKRIKGE